MNLQESIRRILREERSGNDRIKSMIKNIGIKRSANIVGGFEKLKSISGIDNYNDFLNLFSDLEKVKSEVDPKFTIYRNKVGNNIIVVEDREFYVDKYVYVNRDIIYESIILLIKNGNSKRHVDYFDVLPIVKIWLQNQHNIDVLKRQIDFFQPKSEDFGWYETLI